MIFKVIWRKAAEEALASIWINSADRNAITTAAHRIDQQLQSDPLMVGKARKNGRRMLFASPLVVIYRIFP